eukprot:1157280-Pelagomonas_calceolata.AAC.11
MSVDRTHKLSELSRPLSQRTTPASTPPGSPTPRSPCSPTPRSPPTTPPMAAPGQGRPASTPPLDFASSHRPSFASAPLYGRHHLPFLPHQHPCAPAEVLDPTAQRLQETAAKLYQATPEKVEEVAKSLDPSADDFKAAETN